MSVDVESLINQAKEVLRSNWIGFGTKPAPRLYPHQWSWDSAFIAIGYAHYDQDRAQQELRSLFRGQWRDGMLPHIVFNPEVKDYSPEPKFWRIDRSIYSPGKIKTSGLVQPPVHATAVWHIYQHAQDEAAARDFLKEMFPKLVDWHAYLYRERNPEGNGLVSIIHPWESGQDNSPIWDRAMARITLNPEMVPEYKRVDTALVASEERPSEDQYDRYAYLVKLFWENHYDTSRIHELSPFQLQDVLFNTLLIQANRDLANIGRALGEEVRQVEEWEKQTASSMNAKLWDEEHGIYFDYDLVAGQRIHAHVAAGFSPIYAGVPSSEQAEKILENLNSGGFCPINEECWAVPSYDREEPGYAPNRFWRGPVWINVNWILYNGLRRYGYDFYAERVKQAIIELPRIGGFYEHFNPDNGQGHGAENFSWTAALLLDLLLAEDSHDE